MRNGQNKRMRGRNRKGQNPLTRVYESNGPDVKVRGTASHIADKYVQLARDAQSSGDPVGAENYYQHAEHYFRLIAAVQEQFRQANPYYREGEAREGAYEETDEEGADQGAQGMGGEPYAPREQPYPQREPQPYGPREPRFPPRDREQPQHYRRPQQQASDDGEVDRLPAFVTGGAPQEPQQGHGGNGPNGQNGYEGAPDRFPLHRRRRRRHGPREGSQQSGGEPGDGTTRTPGE